MGKLKFNLDKEVPHNILSGFMMSQEDFDNEKDYTLCITYCNKSS